jgi:hypothetical protein
MITKYIIVCGGRAYTDKVHLHTSLNAIWEEFPDAELVEGGHREYYDKERRFPRFDISADAMANEWAWLYGIKAHTEYAKWDAYNDAAGPIRNKTMVIKYPPILVVAFPGGRGTKSMTRIAHEYGVPVRHA